ncbi:hypothetical protein BT93_E1361 [Corymbia citriodora subsp. variegata]|nr:hypothetical protein BT93_E1361 [Corymbia citriodora subsp. variegata]
MAPWSPITSRTQARTKKKDPFARCFSEAEHGRRKGGSGKDVGGSGARQRNSVLGGWGTGGMAGDDDHEVIIITDSADGSDEASLVRGSVEEEEEPCDYGLQTGYKFEPNQVSREGQNIVVDDDGGGGGGGGGSDEEESADDSDEEVISVRGSVEEEEEPCNYGLQTGRRFKPNRVSRKGQNIVLDDDGGGGGSDKEESADDSDEVISVSGTVEEEEEPCDHGLQFKPSQVSRKGKNIVVDVDDGGDPDKEKSIDDQSDDDLIGCGEVRSFGSEDDNYAQNVSGKSIPLVTKDSEADLSSDSLSSSTESSSEADDSSDEDFVAYTSEHLSSEEYASGSESDETLQGREKRKCEDKGELSCLYSETKNNKKLATNCIDYLTVDNVGSKESVSGVDAEEKEEEAIDADRLNGKIDCPAIADNGNSGQKEEEGSSSASECRGSRETEETGCWGEDGNERLQEEGKAAAEFDVASAETDVSFINEKGKMGQMEERGNLTAPEEEERLKQSREKSTSQSKAPGVDRRMEERRYGKHVQSDSNPFIRDTSSSRVRGRKEKDWGMSCSSQQLRKKRKHEDCSGEKASVNEIAEYDCRANWRSRTREERAREPWLQKFFDLADFLWGEDDLLQDNREKENAEREKQCAGDSTTKQERKESTECRISTKPSEEGVRAHQAEAIKDSRSTRDYRIHWERSGKSKEFKYFKRNAKKFRSN